jgi:hypothetical protein
MAEAPKAGYARLERPDIFGIAIRGKSSAIGRAKTHARRRRKDRQCCSYRRVQRRYDGGKDHPR